MTAGNRYNIHGPTEASAYHAAGTAVAAASRGMRPTLTTHAGVASAGYVAGHGPNYRKPASAYDGLVAAIAGPMSAYKFGGAKDKPDPRDAAKAALDAAGAWNGGKGWDNAIHNAAAAADDVMANHADRITDLARDVMGGLPVDYRHRALSGFRTPTPPPADTFAPDDDDECGSGLANMVGAGGGDGDDDLTALAAINPNRAAVAVAVHEASHAVVASLLGRVPWKVNMDPIAGGYSGECHTNSLHPDAEAAGVSAAILAAGMAGEELFGVSCGVAAQAGENTDMRRLSAIAASYSAAAPLAYVMRATERACALLRPTRHHVMALARRLLTDGVVIGKHDPTIAKLSKGSAPKCPPPTTPRRPAPVRMAAVAAPRPKRWTCLVAPPLRVEMPA